jgi:hypothetical protein
MRALLDINMIIALLDGVHVLHWAARLGEAYPDQPDHHLGFLNSARTIAKATVSARSPDPRLPLTGCSKQPPDLLCCRVENHSFATTAMEHKPFRH